MIRAPALGLCWGLLGLLAAVPIPILFQQQGGRSVLLVFLLIVLGSLALVRPVAMISGAFVFLAFMGDFRRYVGSVLGFAGYDPILLVAPIIAVCLLVGPAMANRIRLDTPLSAWVLALMGWMVAQMFNPLQGGVAVGFAGALFYLVPLLWYWIGKTCATPDLVEFIAFGVVLPIAVAASCLGLYQVFFGLLPFEQAWVDARGYAALWVGGTIRPISFFTSAAEYVKYLTIAIAFAWAGWLRGRRTWLLIVPLLWVAMFAGSSRTPIVISLFAIAALWAAQGQSRTVWLPRLALALAIGVVGLVVGLNQAATGAFGERVDGLVAHQAQGLLNPLDREHSTARTHVAMMVNGFIEGLHNPLGNGLGSTTLAAAKFGGSQSSTEIDLSNLMVSLGLPGGIVYGVIIVMVLLMAVRYWRQTRSLSSLVILAALIAVPGAWLIGGDYAVATLIWFLIGALDRLAHEEVPAGRLGASLRGAAASPLSRGDPVAGK